MRDGTKLATEVYLPSGTGPWPVLLTRTPYGRKGVDPSALTTRGYVVVAQDTRGTGQSEDGNLLFVADGWGELQDGLDTVNWICSQSWCNGKVGTFGGSASGITQALLAPTLPPGLICQHIYAAPFDLFSSIRHGGVLRKAMVESWLGRHGTREALETILSHPDRDGLWSLLDATTLFERVPYPVMHIGGWFDPFCRDTIEAYVGLQHRGAKGARGNQRLVIGPWTHGGISKLHQGELVFPPNSRYDFEGEMLEWFDKWMRYEEGVAGPAVRYYLMGASKAETGGNRWKEAEDWPIPSQTLKLYLQEKGGLSRNMPRSSRSCDTFLYDPTDPVPTLGGANLRVLQPGPMDQRRVESRDDVITYDSPILEEELEVTGRVSVTLWVSSTATTTDFTAKLTDVYPDGRSILVMDDITRVRGLKGAPKVVKIDLGYISMVFAAGHRLRLAISSSNYPRFERNMNTDDPGEAKEGVLAKNTVHHDSIRSSSLILPEVSGGNGPG